MFTDIAPILSVTLMLLTSYNQIHNVWASHHLMGSQMKAWNKLVIGTVLAVGVSQVAIAQEKVTVFAAASLTNALQDIAAQYEKGKDVKVVSSFASSSTLARQIDQGAPADLFISADQQWMDFAIDKKAMVADTRITLLGNDLVLVAAKDSKIDKVNIDKKPIGKHC